MNWNMRYASEKDAGKFREKVIEMGLRALPGVGKGTGRAVARGADTLLSGGTIGEAVQQGVEGFGSIGQGVSRALQNPDVQRTVTKGIDKLKDKLRGTTTPATPATPSTSTTDWDHDDPFDYRNVKPNTTPSLRPTPIRGYSPDDDPFGI